MRALLAMLSIALFALTAACSDAPRQPGPYGASTAKIGESQTLLGWKISMSNLRFDQSHVLVDIDAAPAEQGKPHAKPEDIRFGLYGSIAHPIESDALGSCGGVTSLNISPASAPNADRLSGTVCLGPLDDQRSVRGVYAYSPRDKIANTTAAYPVAFPVGILPTNRNDTGITVKTTSVEAWRGDGSVVEPTALGDPNAFNGNGYMLLGLEASAIKQQYSDVSAEHGGPLMITVAPSLPNSQALSHACAAYGSSVLLLPDSKLDGVQVSTSLCTQGEINQALLYATLSIMATHAAVWTTRD